MQQSIGRRKLLALGAVLVARSELRPAKAAPEVHRELAPAWTAETGRQVLVTVFSPDGKTLASGGSDGAVRLWDTDTGKLRREVPPAVGLEQVQGLCYTPEGKTLVTLARGEARLWDAHTLAPLASLTPPDAGRGMALALSPDGKMLAVGGSRALRGFRAATGPIWLFDLPGRRLIHTLEQPDGNEVVSLAFSPDGRLLAAGDQAAQVLVWPLGGGMQAENAPVKSPLSAAKLLVGGGPVWAVRFSPDGKLLATGGHDRTVTLWNPRTGEPVRTLGTHDHLVLSLGFSPDGALLASGGYDNALKLWDVRAGKLEHSRKLDGWVHSVPFSGDGLQLSSGDAAGKIRLWNVMKIRPAPAA
jgi:WD40 repeat protein